MAVTNKILSNHLTGQDVHFIQTAADTNGELLEMQTTYHSHSTEPPLHYHPQQEEYFTVLAGELTVRIHGNVKTLKPGEHLHIDKNTAHAMWNNSNQKTIVHWKVLPAMNTEQLFETIYGLVNDGKTNKKGIPSLLQMALTANRFANVFRVSKPPYIIQKIVFYGLTPFALLAGKKAVYKKYTD